MNNKKTININQIYKIESKQNLSVSDIKINETLWDDGVKYAIYCILFLIFVNKGSILFGTCSIVMLIYFIFFEYKHVFKMRDKSVKTNLIIKAFISFVLFINIKPITGNKALILLINQYLILILIFWSLVWSENIFFDDRSINFYGLFTTQNGEYCRVKYVANALNINLSFSKEYSSIHHNLLYLDRLAHKLDNTNIRKLKKYKLILSVNSGENKFKTILYNFICLFFLLAINNKADIQIGNIDGISLFINNDEKIIFVSVVLILIIFFCPIIIKLYRSVQIMKKKKLLLLIIDRAIQIKEDA
ncbi:hypothetical protein CXB72_09280 [Lactobacillus acidophilus]|uniref:hypothetical protein n=1 Tax=Lactobacillus acidophilus TaxID=1579 RepID=UPI000F757050|nr:hypothetical protein [Lactobacillus acidophilus]AZN77293.1 hypothetical protein CXB72_09280 [Lactobacillus acidophilus]